MTLGDEYDADVVIVGAGAAGLAAGVAAATAGASVLIVDENSDIGGHAILSGGWVTLGGGHSLQREQGILDSPDAVYDDWVAEVNGRYSDRELALAFSQASVDTFEFLVDSGVEFLRERPAVVASGSEDRPLRQFHAVEWPDREQVIAPDRQRNGSGVVRPLERRARELGVEFRFGHSLDSLEPPVSPGGRVSAVNLDSASGRVTLRARNGVILATGGHTSNVEFRRIFDPRLTEEYQVAGEPYSRQSAAGEIAALRLGAALWGTSSQSTGITIAVAKTTQIGCRWGYRYLIFEPGSRLFDQVRATGLEISDWSDIVLVRGAGERFWNESDDSPGFIDAALASPAAPRGTNGGGPIWAIFDAAHARREGWNLEAPTVDPDGYFFSADTLEDLAAAVDPAIGAGTLDPAVLRATIDRYNELVASGEDSDFGKAGARNQLTEPPFYAAWATPILHDSLTGLRITPRAEVVDVQGDIIHGLYAAGEVQGGFSQHGLARCLVFGRIAGLTAASVRAG